MKLSIILMLFLIVGCSSKGVHLTSDHQILSLSKTGILFTANLETNGKIKRGQKCSLIMRSNNKKYALELEEGKSDYALDLPMGLYQIDELNCGLFYYYKVGKEASAFHVSPGKISYIGQLDFELYNEGKLVWGHASTDHKILEENIMNMGFSPNAVELSLLKF